MLKNYFKIALKVLSRNKFFTFVSLFGISITLMILIVLSSLYDSSFGAYGPEKKLNRMLFINQVKFSDTKGNHLMFGSSSNYFLNKTAKNLKTPETVSITTEFISADCYVGDRKISLIKRYTDVAYWNILEFDFLQGRPISNLDIENANKVAVISRKAGLEYFGNLSCIGQKINIQNEFFTVIGVVEDVTISKFYSFSHIYLPYTTSGIDYSIPALGGNCLALILANSRRDFDAIQTEYQKITDGFQFYDPESYNHVNARALTYYDSIFQNPDDESTLIYEKALYIVLLLLFMAFPAINLINMNVTRIIERSSEIGIRKSFGASIRTLMWQFIVENVIITLLGGILGFIMAAIVIKTINSSGVIPYLILSINFILFFYALGITIFFGLFSGIYPAWKMSKLQIMHVLKIDKQ